MKRFVGFIKNIQESDQDTKRFWHYVFSGILTGLVILIWVANIDSIIPNLYADEKEQEALATKDSKISEVSKTFVAGLSIIFKEAKDKAREESVYQFEAEPEAGDIKLNLPGSEAKE